MCSDTHCMDTVGQVQSTAKFVVQTSKLGTTDSLNIIKCTTLDARNNVQMHAMSKTSCLTVFRIFRSGDAR